MERNDQYILDNNIFVRVENENDKNSKGPEYNLNDLELIEVEGKLDNFPKYLKYYEYGMSNPD